jgi:hypothetical protein
MKVECDCGEMMNPVVDENGKLEFWYPVVTLMYMGQKRFEGSGFYFDCPGCGKTITVIPKH